MLPTSSRRHAARAERRRQHSGHCQRSVRRSRCPASTSSSATSRRATRASSSPTPRAAISCRSCRLVNTSCAATLQGFQTVERRGITLRRRPGRGHQPRRSASAVVAEEIVVVGEASRIHLTSGSVSGVVGEREIRDLPLNGRSFQQLALLQPGVQAALAAGNDVVGGRTPKISINGARPEQNNFLLDGTDINNVYNKTPGSAAGVLLGVDAVLEFQVLTNAYSAEFGRSAGGVINAVTRSGTNAMHGSVFEFHRNSALDARNFFDPPSQPKPDFYRNQFGAVAGGPHRPRSHVLLRRVRRADRTARRHRRHGGARRQRAPRGAADRPGADAPGDSAVHRAAVPARERTVARRRRRPSTSSPGRSRPTSTSARCASITASLPMTACSCATRTIARRSIAFRRTSRRSRSSSSGRATRTSPPSISTRSRRSGAEHPARRPESIGLARRQPAHDRHSALDVVDSRRPVRLPHDPRHGHRDGGRLPSAARRPAQ